MPWETVLNGKDILKKKESNGKIISLYKPANASWHEITVTDPKKGVLSHHRTNEKTNEHDYFYGGPNNY